jgi:glycosyltransferase involved in cell wall biosynthesis
MARVDLHVHSCFSEHPSEWFLKRIGARESYTPIEDVYRQAKSRGMSFVTLTDHNTIDGALQLKSAHPEDVFISVEATTYFPEDGCKIHVLVYGIDASQFNEIERLRTNIYHLRDFLRKNDIPCSVAHANFSINGKLSSHHLEKLILLFNVFEGINGARPVFANNVWKETLKTLTPERIGALSLEYEITPWGQTPWKKSFTGGSDDHAGLFVGQTATQVARADTSDEFLSAIRQGATMEIGRHNDFKGLAFSIYKIAWNFYKSRCTGEDGGNDFLKDISGFIFDKKPLAAKNWLSLQKLKLRKNEKNGAIIRFFEELTACMSNSNLSTDEQQERMYQSIASLADDYFGMILKSIEKDVRKGNAFKLMKDISSALPGIFLSMPFLSTLRHMASNRQVIEQCYERIAGEPLASKKQKRVLWFSDTLHDLNGISETLKCMIGSANNNGIPVTQVVSAPQNELSGNCHEILNLPFIFAAIPDFYDSLTIRFPSLLKSIEIIQHFEPDEIIISTPGPIGLMGLLAAKILSLRCTAIFHTDFTRQAALFIGDDTMTNLTESYLKWFHSMVDEIRVPTRHYFAMLGDRGFQTEKMRLFKRGIDAIKFNFTEEGRAKVRKNLGLATGPVLLWVGRIGKEKSLDFLARVYKNVVRRRGAFTLIIAGDGPILAEVRADFSDCLGVIFTGRIPHDALPWWYSAADVFVFPSVTDTFGMVILEAQACGLPALVSNVGGPQELIENGKTGFVLQENDEAAWTDAIIRMAEMMEREPERYMEMRYMSRKRIEETATWEEATFDLLGKPVKPRINGEARDIPMSLLPQSV